MSYLHNAVDVEGSTRIRLVAQDGKGLLELSEFDTDSWSDTSEAQLDIIGLKALAALCLIVAEELERAK